MEVGIMGGDPSVSTPFDLSPMKNFKTKMPALGGLATSALGAAGGKNYDKSKLEVIKRRADQGKHASEPTRSERVARLDTEAPIRERLQRATAVLPAANERVARLKAEEDTARKSGNIALTTQKEGERKYAEDSLKRANERAQKEADALKKIDVNAKKVQQDRQNEFARSLTPSSRLGRVLQRVTGNDLANREAAAKVRRGESGDTELDKLTKAVKKISEEEAKKKGGGTSTGAGGTGTSTGGGP